MNMNVKLLILGGILVALLVVFGRNPAAESRKQRLETERGKDKLTLSIEKFAAGEKEGGFSMNSISKVFRGTGGSGAGGSGSSRVVSPAPATTALGLPAGTPYNYQTRLNQRSANPYASPYSTETPAPVAPINPYTTTPPVAVPKPAMPAQPQGYYPPPANYNPYSQNDPNNPDMSGARPMYFSGEKAYTVDGNGKPIPMPDGVYRLNDGFTITIQGGRRIAPNG